MRVVFKSQLSRGDYMVKYLSRNLLFIICLAPISPLIRRRTRYYDDKENYSEYIIEWTMIAFSFMLIGTFFSKYIQCIELNYEAKHLRVVYYSFFFMIKREIKIKFEHLYLKQKTYFSWFRKENSFIILETNKERISIDENEDGWNKESIYELIKQIELVIQTSKKDILDKLDITLSLLDTLKKENKDSSKESLASTLHTVLIFWQKEFASKTHINKRLLRLMHDLHHAVSCYFKDSIILNHIEDIHNQLKQKFPYYDNLKPLGVDFNKKGLRFELDMIVNP